MPLVASRSVWSTLALRRQIPSAPHTSFSIRTAASSAPPPSSKSAQLKKPLKYAPPSHPAAFKKREPFQYGGGLSDAQKKAQRRKQYPNMMPPQESLAYRIIHNRLLHFTVTLVRPPRKTIRVPR